MTSRVFKWLLPIVLMVILIPLVTSQRRFHFQRMPSLRDVRTRGILRPMRDHNVHSKSLIARQGGGGLASTLLAGPVFLALSSLLFSFPVLPMLFLAPMAISNFLPNMDDVSDPSINDILQSVQNLGQGILSGIRPASESSSASSATSSSGSSSISSSTSSSGLSSPSSSPLSTSSSDATASGSVSSSSSSSNTLSAMGSASEPIASIVPAPSSSSSSSSSSSPPKTTSSVPSTDSLADLSTGFLSQLAAINDILSNPNSPSSENPLSSFSQLAANTLTSLSNFLFSAKREEINDQKPTKNRIPFYLGLLKKTLQTHSITARSSDDNISPYLSNLLIPGSPRNALTDRLAILNLKSIWSRSSGAATSLAKRIREIYSTFRDGLKRYEISESECQARLICELNQKVVGRSMRNWAKVITDFIRFDERLESLGMGGMAKSTLIDLYQAARKGMTDEECSIAYSRCPVTIAVEPVNNSIMGKLFRRNRVKQSTQAAPPPPPPPPVPAAAAPPPPPASSAPTSSTFNEENGNIMITGNQIYTPGSSSSSQLKQRRRVFH